GALIVLIQRMERRCQIIRQYRIALIVRSTTGALGHVPVVSDVHPQVTEGRQKTAAAVVSDRHPRHLDDPGLDGIDEREAGQDPGGEGALDVAGALEEERRRREIVDRLDPELLTDRFQASDPYLGSLLLHLGLLPVLPRQRLLDLRLAAAVVAVMGLVVDNDDL